MFGKRIAELREEKELTQKQLAKELNLSSAAIGMYETEKRKLDVDKILIFCHFFNVSADYLLGLTEQRNYKLVEKNDILSSDCQELIDIYNSLTIKNQVAVIERARTLLDLERESGIYKKSV